MRQQSFYQQKYYVFPREFVEGLDQLHQLVNRPGLPVATQARSVMRIIKGLYLNAPILNWQYHARQMVQDYANALSNLPVERWWPFSKGALKKLGVYSEEFYHVYCTGRSAPHLRAARDLGLLTETYETLLGDWVGEHVVKGNMMPWRFMNRRTKVWTIVKIIGEGTPGQIWSEVRETAFKEALYEQFVRLGANPEAAAKHANMVQGNYWKVSPLGRLFASMTLFTKWFTNTFTRLTVMAATDPVTGKWSLRGLRYGPWPMIGGIALGIWLINHCNRSQEDQDFADECLGENHPNAIVLPRRLNEKLGLKPNERAVWDVSGSVGIAYLMWDLIRRAAVGERGEFQERAFDVAMGRLGPTAMPLEVLYGRTAEGIPLEPAGLADAPRAYRVEANAQLGGWPGMTASEQYALEAAGGWVPRAIRLMRSEKTLPIDMIRQAGPPLFRVRETDERARRLAVYGRYWMQEYAELEEQPATAARDKRLEELDRRFSDHGVTRQELNQQLSKWRNAIEKRRAWTPEQVIQERRADMPPLSEIMRRQRAEQTTP